MTRKEKAALGAAGSVLFAVGFSTSCPLISALMIAVLAACVKYGELWEV